MTRYKKFVKSEKAKTQLKGAKLAKGLNVTKTDFKIKKIAIREQIRDKIIIEDGAIIRVQNIKELLSKLHHHNASNRNEGVRYLKEMVTNHPDEASKHLGAIIQGISQLCLDVEKDIRKECYKALNLVLASQTPTIIAPFFNTISSYLRCAMTHIHIQIQEDSLYMLDCLLLHMPLLVAANSDSIFSNFLDMISKLRIESKPERTLTVNLGSKITSVKWRSKVLHRLLGILKAIVHERKQRNHFTDENIGQSKLEHYNMEIEDAFTSDKNDAVSNLLIKADIKFDTDAAFYTSKLIRRNLNRTCELPFLFKKASSFGNNTASLITEKDEGDRIRKYAELVMPLLIESWMEVRPASLNNVNKLNMTGDDIHISNEAAFTLKATLEIIEKLYELMIYWDEEVNNHDLTDWFRSTYNKEFCTQFIWGFPYLQGDGFKGSKKKSKGLPTEQDVHESGGSRCYQQNLSVANIFCCLNKNLTRAQYESGEKVIKFIKNNLQQFDFSNIDASLALVRLLRIILIENGENWIKTNIGVSELLKQVLLLYQNGKFGKEIQMKILILLCDIVLNHTLCTAYGNESFALWLPTLPKMLCQPYISQHVLKTFSHLAKQQNEIFLKQFEDDVPYILANLPEVQVTGITDAMDGKKMIIKLFYWLKRWNGPCALPDDTNSDVTEINKYLNEIISIHVR